MRLSISACLAIVSSAVVLPAASEGVSIPTGQCKIGHWSSNRNLDANDDVGLLDCSLTWRQALGDSSRFVVSGRGGYAASGAAEEWDGRVREAYIDWQEGAWSLRLGRQVLAWGRADRINPTDNLAPRDFTLLVAEDEDQKLGIDAARVRYELSSSLSGSVLLSRFGAHKTPTGSLPSNTTKAVKPGGAEWAVKLDHTGPLDWSLSYFDGFERLTRYTTVFSSPTAVVFQGAFERSKALGFDAATALGAWTVRTELAYTELQPSCTDCAQYKRKVARAVVGADRDFLETSNVNFQVFALRRSSYVDPIAVAAAQRSLAIGLNRLNTEFGKKEWGITLRVAHRALNERLTLEVSGIADVTNRSAVVRPRLSYSISDNLKWGVGADFFRGKTHSFFGSRKENQTLFSDITLLF